MSEEPCVEFGPLTIWYDVEGLRPRPWTQVQSSWGAELLRGLPDGDVLELCAGPGQIGLLALVEADRAEPRPSRHLVQVDAAETACRLARRNAAAAGLADRVDVRCGDLEGCLTPDERFVLVIADPPWVPTERTRDYPDDPVSAIDGGPDGLDVVRTLLPVVEQHLHPSGAALLQVGGPEQVDGVRELLASTRSTLRVTDSRPAPGSENGALALLVH